MAEQLEAVAHLIAAGKVRYAGISNETAWGLTRFIATAESTGLPRMASVQNQYNLLDRTFERGLQEVCVRERVGMLAFSPLAMGVLTGKYTTEKTPPSARLRKFSRYQSRWGRPEQVDAAARFARSARTLGHNPAELALAWVRHQPGVASVLSSCTSVEQVSSLIASATLGITDAICEEIEAAAAVDLHGSAR